MPQSIRLCQDYNALLCPNCASTYLHLEYVMVHAQREDRPGVDVVVQVQTGAYRVLEELSETVYVPERSGDATTARPAYSYQSNGPAQIVPPPIYASGRRDHTVLRFTCENCSGVKELRFEQHKGETYSGWTAR